MKNLLIIGAGVAGITAALDLNRRYKNQKNINITIFNREPYFLFYPHLYEVASAPEEITSLSGLKKSVAIPLEDIFNSTKVRVIKETVTQVNLQQRTVTAGRREFAYDVLIEALGSRTNFFGIPGAAEFSFGLKSVADALKIRNQIEFLVEAARQNISKDTLRIVVAGGGFLGVEMAAELKGYMDFLAWKNNFPRHKLQLYIIEGSGRILPGLPDRTAGDVRRRLEQLGVLVQTNRFISVVDRQFIEYSNGERFRYDCLIWAAGVKANSMAGSTAVTDRMGRVVTTGCLQTEAYSNILYAGDQACVMNSTGAPMPATIPAAEAQGRYAAYAASELLKNKKPRPFIVPRQPSYFITVGGRWAVLDSRYVYLAGYSAYVLRWFVYLHFFASLIGWFKALKLSLSQWGLYGKNDPI